MINWLIIMKATRIISLMGSEEIVRHMIEAWDENKTEELDEIYHQDAVDHWGPEELGSTYTGLEEIKNAESRFRQAFPDYSMELLRTTGEGELVSFHWIITGSHKGEFMGIPPTGNQVNYDGMAFLRLEDGKIAESWWITNRLRLLREIEAAPTDEELAERIHDDQ